MNKLSRGQFLSLLLINDAFLLICIQGDISLKTAAAFAAATLIQVLFAVPLIIMYRKGHKILQTSRTLKLILLIYMILSGRTLFNTLWHTSSAVYIPYENRGLAGKLIIAAAIAVICIYVAFLGESALARSTVITAAAGTFCIAGMLLISAVNSDIKTLLLPDTETSFFHEITRGLALSSGTGCFVFLLGETKGDPFRNSLSYFTARFVLYSAIITASLLSAGGIMHFAPLPVLTAAQLIQPFSSQRTDALFLIVFSCLAVFASALHILIGGNLLKCIIPFAEKYRYFAVSVLMISSAVIAGEINEPVLAVLSLGILLLLPVGSFFSVSKNIQQKRIEI